jgi:hypothetical protein
VRPEEEEEFDQRLDITPEELPSEKLFSLLAFTSIKLVERPREERDRGQRYLENLEGQEARTRD